MPITLDQDETLCLIRLEGDINVTFAAELKTILLQALGTAKDVRLNLERVTELDVTAVQLFWAALQEAKKAGVGFTLVGCMPETVSAALSAAGFEKVPIPAEAV